MFFEFGLKRRLFYQKKLGGFAKTTAERRLRWSRKKSKTHTCLRSYRNCSFSPNGGRHSADVGSLAFKITVGGLTWPSTYIPKPRPTLADILLTCHTLEIQVFASAARQCSRAPLGALLTAGNSKSRETKTVPRLKLAAVVTKNICF